MELDISGARILFTIPTNIPILGDFEFTETILISWIILALISGLCIWLGHDLKVENISKRQAAAEMLLTVRRYWAQKSIMRSISEPSEERIHCITGCCTLTQRAGQPRKRLLKAELRSWLRII